MTAPADRESEERIQREAGDWFARSRGPGSEGLADAIAAWRAADPAHEVAWMRLQQRWDQTAFLASSKIGRGRDLRRASVWHRRPAVRTMAAAAILLLVVTIGLFTFGHAPGTVPPASASEYASAAGAQRAIVLADRSRVTLDANSAIRVETAPGARRLRLVRGRARFEPADVPGRPFVVHAGNGTVRAAGGTFDVELQGSRVQVAAWRGTLDIACANATGAVGPVRIGPGRQILFGPDGLSAPGPVSPAGYGWAQAMLTFDGTPLEDAVARFNRVAGPGIRLEGSGAASLRVTGAFSANDAPGFARAVADMFDLDLTRSADGAIVLGQAKKT